jgi:MtaA/CmuA family methyltransferase
MKSKELIERAFHCKEVSRIPWVPFVGCHGGSLIGVNAKDYLQSADHIVAGVNAAVKRYKPDGIPIVFDLQVEAEIFGCDLIWADENPPAVASHPLGNGKTIDAFDLPNPDQGRLTLILDAARRLRKQHPDIALYGLITGPFTLAMHLHGTDLFIKMIEEADYVKEVIGFTRNVAIQMAKYYIDAGCDVIALVDPLTSQIGPDQFRQFITEPATSIFDEIRAQKALSSFFVCGHAQKNIEAMCECRPDNVAVDENIPLDYVRDVSRVHQISFGGNLQLTVVLLLGTHDDARRNAIECIQTGGNQGFILSPGCDLPFATPPANIEAIAEIIRDPYQMEVAKTLESKSADQELMNMQDYGKTEKVVVDIITLDSEACAPCQYMVEAVKKIAPQFEGIVEWREHKIKHQHSLKFMTSLMVKNIPTICIDGKITFVSRIPPKEELVAAIQRRIYEKLQYKIRTKNGSLFILGRSEEEISRLKPLVKTAIEELGADIQIEEITDEKEILSYGVLKTPAIVVAQYKVKSEEGVPSVPIIKEWIKDIA